MRACVVAWTVAVVAAAALSCAPPDEERCGDSGKYLWDAALNACFEVTTEGPAPTEPVNTTPDTNTDTDIAGLGDPCNAFGTGNGCEGKDAGICAYFAVEQEGKCSIACSDTTGHSDCPTDWLCCVFVPVSGYTVCLPQDWWDQTSKATCSKK